jgi:hypothetical protein
MKKDELLAGLKSLGVSEDAFSLNDGLKSDAFIVEENYGMWYVFYYEKGERCEERLFIEESKAYQYLFERFVKESHNYDFLDD